MPRKMVVIFAASSILWMVFAASQAFKIETSPASKIIAQLGDSISMTCSTTHCESPAFSWAALMDRPLNGKVINEGNRSTLVTNPVNLENDYSYLCFVTCESKKRRREFSVEIYSFPKDPEIHFSGHPELGKPVTVTCFVPDVYPSDKLKIELLKGNQFLSQKEFLDPADVKSQETKSLEATFTPADEDNGTALVCRATLNVYEIDSEPQVRETTEQLHIYVSPKDTVISVSPSTRLQEGDSVTMTCSSRGLPAPQIFWRKKLDNGDLQLLSENATLTLIAMRMEDSGTYVCEGVNKVGQDREEVTLIVQEKMFTVEISPGPWVAAQIGDLVVLTCIVTGCESPSFSWRTQLDSPLSGNVNTEGSRSTLTLSPVSLEHEHSYQCAVTCGHDKELERKTQVKLYLFPRNLEIEMSGLFVSGKPVTVRCQVPDVYSFDRLEIELFKGESIMKNKTFLRDVDTKSLETKSLEMTFIPTTEDTGKVLVCQAKLSIDEMEFELKQKQNTQTLYVNVAPQVTAILVSPSSVLEEGGSVNMTCSSDGLPAPKTLWSKQLNNGDLQPLSENTTLTLMSTKMEDSGIYVCEGINQAGISRKEVELIIQVAPKDIQLTAFPSESVREGDTVIISCTCGNAPQTLIILKKKAETGDTLLKSTDGAYTIHKAQLQDAGVYECESKNEVGFQLRSITLNVKVIILKKADLANEVTMCSKNGIFTLCHVMQHDTGGYVISASNEVGDDSGWIEMSVMKRESSKDYFSPELLVLYCASSLVIPATGMIIYFARRANMRGSYSLV